MKRLFITVLILGLVAQAVSAQNPFTSRPGQSSPGGGEIYTGSVPQVILEWSQNLQRELSRLSLQISQEGRVDLAFLAFALAVLFGIVHILGPGHGKVFTVSYFLGRDASLKTGLAYSALINVIDSLSAAFFVFLGLGVLQVVFTQFRGDVDLWLQIISYSVIILLVLGHLLSHLRGHSHDHDDQPSQDDSGNRGHGSQPKKKGPLALALAVGLVPCPVSTSILVYGVANDIIGLSALLVLGVSVGGFIAMSVLAMATMAGRKGILKLIGNHGGSVGKILLGLEVASSVVIVAFAVVMILVLAL